MLCFSRSNWLKMVISSPFLTSTVDCVACMERKRLPCETLDVMAVHCAEGHAIAIAKIENPAPTSTIVSGCT